ncbi:MAG: glycosyltransferase family 4 protein [Cyanophyceae cyanobacterium]
MNANQQKSVALISVHGDPAVEIGKEEAGGQNVYVRQVGEALAKQGWQVDMFTRAAAANQPKEVQHTENCRTIRLVAGPEEFVPRQEIFSYRYQFVEQLLSFQQAHNYALMHTNYWISGWVGLELKRKLVLPMVHTYHSLGAVKYQCVEPIPPIANTRLEIEKVCLETADCIIATSPQEREHMRSLVSPRGHIQVVPCGTDPDRYGLVTRQEARKRLGIAAEAKIVFYIGRFDKRKGIETLVRAAHQSQWRDELRVFIGGGSRPGQSDGLERDRLERIVADLGMTDKIIFPGRITDEELPLYYTAADVCVVPSHYEPFGLVAIEAMASGTPVVASHVGGLQYTIVDRETGLLPPPQDVSAFAKSIDRILGDAQWRDWLGKNGEKRVREHFSWHSVAAQLSDIYTRLLSGRSLLDP